GQPMLIVCTQDPVIRDVATEPGKGIGPWRPAVLLPVGPQAAAREAFAAALHELPAGQALCLSAHGNDTEIGDANEGWDWTAAAVANLLEEHAPPGWRGPILIHACARTVAQFSGGLAVALEMRRVFDGLWCYGYNRAVPADEGFPPPGGLARRADLQGTRVG
ncbi:MAG TPA: hypothetical protein VMF55_12480, partial [Solirubrobacterales bacterium]|nr:hypothetical protein [Solirubrobacterales bacterium]